MVKMFPRDLYLKKQTKKTKNQVRLKLVNAVTKTPLHQKHQIKSSRGGTNSPFCIVWITAENEVFSSEK